MAHERLPICWALDLLDERGIRRGEKLALGLDIGSLFALGALRYFECHFLPFFEGFEPSHLDG